MTVNAGDILATTLLVVVFGEGRGRRNFGRGFEGVVTVGGRCEIDGDREDTRGNLGNKESRIWSIWDSSDPADGGVGRDREAKRSGVGCFCRGN